MPPDEHGKDKYKEGPKIKYQKEKIHYHQAQAKKITIRAIISQCNCKPNRYGVNKQYGCQFTIFG